MSEKKLWGGRFRQATNLSVEAYTQSVLFDKAMYKQDIAGSKAHALMLAEQGILTEKEAQILCEGLDKVLWEIENKKFIWREDYEDVHMNIEARLTELVGEVGGKLHTARSRNDQTALDFRLFVSDCLREWQGAIKKLITVFVCRAEQSQDILLPGYTHLQPAQPISLAQHLLAYAFMFKRDFSRIEDAEKRVRISPLGAGALAGTTYPINPQFVAKQLNMYGIFDNSLDAVSDRDFVLEGLFCASLIMMHLSRFCEEIILWANPQFGFVKLPDAYATGSSMMPQKKNPDVAEIMRGKIGRVYGDLTGMLTIMKGLPLSYNRDLQEDKEPFFDANNTVSSSLSIMADMLNALQFNGRCMQEALNTGFLNATELADYLVTKGIPFRQAHHITGEAVALAEKQGLPLEDMTLAELKKLCGEIDESVYEALKYDTAVWRRNSPGGTGPLSVKLQLDNLKKWLE